MGYMKDLDEYTDAELRVELAKRSRLRERGKCDYCERSVKAPECRFPERHRPMAGSQK